MINKIELNNIATYKNETITPKKINFIYGGNGTGKTSLSKFLATPENYPASSYTCDNYPIDILVYNKDFIEENFGKDKAIKGIFTIGEENKEVEEKIQHLIEQKEEIEKQRTVCINKINEFTQNALTLRDEFCNKCWAIKKFAEPYKKSIAGVLHSKEAFADMCDKYFTNIKSSVELNTFDEKYKILYETQMQTYNEFTILDLSRFKMLEESPILSTSILAKEDNPLSAIIKNLNNSDWIKQGTEYLNSTKNVCPFCQRELTNEIKINLENLFDQEYDKSMFELNQVNDEYRRLSANILSNIEDIIQASYIILDYSKIKVQLFQAQSIIKENIRILNDKIEHPSNKVELTKTYEILNGINDLIIGYNKIIVENNKLFAKQSQEKTNLTADIWHSISNNYLFDIIGQFRKNSEGINSATRKMMMKRDSYSQDILNLEKEINNLQSKVSTIDKAINEINKILKGFAFTGFYLKKASDGRNYEIIREDGSNAKDTLSEGEERFITFLYFVQLINGNIENRRTINKKVVVIDDPISSLDSNVLFIVSSLVKEIINDCINETNLIEQVFVLTHNIYFHHQISFRPKSNQISPKLVSYFTIHKKDNQSTITQSNKNSIQTSYELLWQEIKQPEKASRANIFNSMRRILEYYFDIIGGLDYDNLIKSFDGEERLICNSLISFVNANSHSIADDFVIGFSEEDIDKYLMVFKKIFVNSNHGAHYDMMMARDY